MNIANPYLCECPSCNRVGKFVDASDEESENLYLVQEPKQNDEL